MSKLSDISCPQLENVTVLSTEDVKKYLHQLNNSWDNDQTKKQILFDFQFKNYYETIAFVNALAWISHQQDHHPDLEVGYNHCLVRYSTHSAGGLSIKDFVCAALVEKLTHTST